MFSEFLDSYSCFQEVQSTNSEKNPLKWEKDKSQHQDNVQNNIQNGITGAPKKPYAQILKTQAEIRYLNSKPQPQNIIRILYNHSYIHNHRITKRNFEYDFMHVIAFLWLSITVRMQTTLMQHKN